MKFQEHTVTSSRTKLKDSALRLSCVASVFVVCIGFLECFV